MGRRGFEPVHTAIRRSDLFESSAGACLAALSMADRPSTEAWQAYHSIVIGLSQGTAFTDDEITQAAAAVNRQSCDIHDAAAGLAEADIRDFYKWRN